MAWTTPLTAVANAALTAAQWNASVRDNLNETGPAKVTAAGQILVSTGANALAARTISGARVDTVETTASATYVALTTPGPAVTVTTGTSAIVAVSMQGSNNTAGGSAVMGFAVSGASTIAASDTDALQNRSSGTGNDVLRATTLAFLLGSLTAGSNTFTAQYKTNGVGTGTMGQRYLGVIPL